MCVIIDADIARRVFCSPTPDEFAPLMSWLIKKNGRITYGGLNGKQLKRIRLARETIQEWKRTGIAWEVDGVDAEQIYVENQLVLESNDAHIIALARKGGARVLCSKDQDLHKDFKNIELVPFPRGKIYQNATHSRVLGHTSACQCAGR